MFRREVKKIDGLLSHFLRAAGLETPLLQRRLIDAWPEVAGQTGSTSMWVLMSFPISSSINFLWLFLCWLVPLEMLFPC